MYRLQKDADEANKRASVLERGSQRFERQLADMAQQVILLPVLKTYSGDLYVSFAVSIN